VQERLLGLFSEFAQNGPGHLDGLKRLIEHGGFRTLDSEAGEFKVLAAYQQDGIYRGIVDKLTARTDLSPADARTALEQLTQVQSGRLLYKTSDAGKQQQILDAVYQTVTDARFRGLAPNQQDTAIDSLMLSHNLLIAPEDGGVDRALKAAAAVKPKEPAGSPPAGPGQRRPRHSARRRPRAISRSSKPRRTTSRPRTRPSTTRCAASPARIR
jgi:hypothetical protein